MTGAWLSAILFCVVLWSPELATDLGLWWLFTMIVVSTTIAISGLTSLLLSLALHRHIAPRYRFLSGALAGSIAIPLSLVAGLMSDAPFSGNFLIHVCVITAMVCLVLVRGRTMASLCKRSIFH